MAWQIEMQYGTVARWHGHRSFLFVNIHKEKLQRGVAIHSYGLCLLIPIICCKVRVSVSIFASINHEYHHTCPPLVCNLRLQLRCNHVHVLQIDLPLSQRVLLLYRLDELDRLRSRHHRRIRCAEELPEVPACDVGKPLATLPLPRLLRGRGCSRSRAGLCALPHQPRLVEVGGTHDFVLVQLFLKCGIVHCHFDVCVRDQLTISTERYCNDKGNPTIVCYSMRLVQSPVDWLSFLGDGELQVLHSLVRNDLEGKTSAARLRKRGIVQSRCLAALLGGIRRVHACEMFLGDRSPPLHACI